MSDIVQPFAAGFVNSGVISDDDQLIVAPTAYDVEADGEDYSEFFAHAQLVNDAIRANPALAESIAAMLNRAHALGAGTLAAPSLEVLGEVVEAAVDLMDEHALEAVCEPNFSDVMRCGYTHVDELRVFTDPDTITGTREGWTIQARIRIDTDCGESNRQVLISGRTFDGRTELTSVVACPVAPVAAVRRLTV